MNQNNSTKDRFESMFKIVKKGLAYCLLCHSHIEIMESIEIEFWRHQTQRVHLEFLIDIFIAHKQFYMDQSIQKKCSSSEESPIKINATIKKKKKLEEKKEIKKELQKQVQMCEEEDIQIIIEDDDQPIKRQQNQKELIISDSSFESGLMNVSGADFKSLAQWNQKKQKSEEKKKSNLNNISYYDLVQKYFGFFIKQLMSKGCFLEAMCFILAKIGKNCKEICSIRFEEIGKIVKFHKNNNKLSPQLQKLFKECAKKLWEEFAQENEGYLIQQPHQPKDVRAMLDKQLISTIKSFQ